MDKLHTLNIGTVPTTPQGKTEEVNEIADINTMYINICSYIKFKTDHNTYITGTLKGLRISNTLV